MVVGRIYQVPPVKQLRTNFVNLCKIQKRSKKRQHKPYCVPKLHKGHLIKLIILIIIQQTFPFNNRKTETLSTMNILFLYNMCIYMFQLFLFSGTYNVLINPGKSFKRINFRLKAKVSSRKTEGILCEKGNYVFMSIGLRSLRFKTSIIFLN